MVGLNLGSGPHANVAPAPKWMNVDRYNLPHWPRPPDVMANVLEGLPFPDDHFDCAYLGHLLEHLEYNEEIPVALREVRRVCKADSPVRVVGPCFYKARALGSAYELEDIIKPPEEFTEPPGIEHRWLPTTDATLRAIQLLLDPVAFEVPVGTVRPPEWPNAAPGAEWQVAVAATIKKDGVSAET